MKILVSWLRDFVDVPAGADDIASRLTRSGFEVSAIEPTAGTDDAVLDLEITANRPDCLSVYGIAREVATLFDAPLAPRVKGAIPAAVASDAGALPVAVAIDDPEGCPRYAAGVADVQVAPSPAWLASRLTAVGVRPISNIVDITNYVLVELGQPTHAFDQAKLADSRLVIRRAAPGEALTTLDGQARRLDEDMLVIADGRQPQALAGIMGGASSEVSNVTRTIVLESASFQPRTVRRTSRRLGLATEASYRFERGTDPDLPVLAIARAWELLEAIAAGRPRPGVIDVNPAPSVGRVVTLRHARIGRILGVEVPVADCERVLPALGFQVEPGNDRAARTWSVGVPTWRADVTREIDLVEEVGRHFGYERLPDTFPPVTVAPPPLAPRLARDLRARAATIAAGFSECVTFSFMQEAAAELFADRATLVPLANPLSENFAVLRPSMLPGVIDSVAHNRRRQIRDVRLFEIGTRFSASAGETRGIGLAWTGAATPGHWSGSERQVDFFDASGVAEAVCEGLGLVLHCDEANVPFLVEGRSARAVVRPDGGDPRQIGWIGQLVPRVAEVRGLPADDEVYVAELDLDAVADLVTLGENVIVRPPPRQPAVQRDLSILVADTLPARAVRDTIWAAAPATLERVREFDRYRGAGVPDGLLSLSLRLTFRDPARTLTDQEVQSATDTIVAALARDHGARLR